MEKYCPRLPSRAEMKITRASRAHSRIASNRKPGRGDQRNLGHPVAQEGATPPPDSSAGRTRGIPVKVRRVRAAAAGFGYRELAFGPFAGFSAASWPLSYGSFFAAFFRRLLGRLLGSRLLRRLLRSLLGGGLATGGGRRPANCPAFPTAGFLAAGCNGRFLCGASDVSTLKCKNFQLEPSVSPDYSSAQAVQKPAPNESYRNHSARHAPR